MTKQAAVPSFPGGGDQEINTDDSVSTNLSVEVRILLLQHKLKMNLLDSNGSKSERSGGSRGGKRVPADTSNPSPRA